MNALGMTSFTVRHILLTSERILGPTCQVVLWERHQHRPAIIMPLVSVSGYITSTGEVDHIIDRNGIWTLYQYDDPGRRIAAIENYQDGDPGPGDQDRVTSYEYDGEGQLTRLTRKGCASGVFDEVTDYLYGVAKTGTSTPGQNSSVASNNLLRNHFPGSEFGGAVFKLVLPAVLRVQCAGGIGLEAGSGRTAHNHNATEHTYDYDSRGRVIQDKVPYFYDGIDTRVQRISTTYDAIDRRILVSSHNSTVESSQNPGTPTVLNQVQYQYGGFNTISTIKENVVGPVTGVGTQVITYGYASFPTDGNCPN